MISRLIRSSNIPVLLGLLAIGCIPGLASAQFVNGVETGAGSAAQVSQGYSAPHVLRVEPRGVPFVINFDSSSEPCAFLSTTALREEFAGLGVHFTGPDTLDGGGVLDECGNFGVSGHSSPNFLAFNTTLNFSDGGVPTGPQTITFDTPVDAMSLLAGHTNAGTITLDAFDSMDVLVDSDSITSSPAMQAMTVSAPEIAKVTISFTGTAMVIDDISFGVPGLNLRGRVATASLLAILGILILAMSRNARRNRCART